MGLRAIVAIAMLTAVVLAGCSSKDDSTGASSSPTASSAAGPGSGSAAPSGSGSAKPTGSASASASASPSAGSANHKPAASLAASNTKGPAPLRVNFTVTASDADADALTYTLSFGDGTADAKGPLPVAKVSHNYTAAGNLTATLTVSDGKSTVVANTTISVQAAGSGGSGGGSLTPVEYKCTVTVGVLFVSFHGQGVATRDCDFTTTTVDSVFIDGTPAASCALSDGSAPPEAGKSYPSGTKFSMVCDPGAANAEGVIHLSA